MNFSFLQQEATCRVSAAKDNGKRIRYMVVASFSVIIHCSVKQSHEIRRVSL